MYEKNKKSLYCGEAILPDKCRQGGVKIGTKIKRLFLICKY